MQIGTRRVEMDINKKSVIEVDPISQGIEKWIRQSTQRIPERFWSNGDDLKVRPDTDSIRIKTLR